MPSFSAIQAKARRVHNLLRIIAYMSLADSFECILCLFECVDFVRHPSPTFMPFARELKRRACFRPRLLAKSLRQRDPFRLVSDIPETDQDVPDGVLDEQGKQPGSWKQRGKLHRVLTGIFLEQEAIIEHLHEENVCM
jgi:hypothetical protein